MKIMFFILMSPMIITILSALFKQVVDEGYSLEPIEYFIAWLLIVGIFLSAFWSFYFL